MSSSKLQVTMKERSRNELVGFHRSIHIKRVMYFNPRDQLSRAHAHPLAVSAAMFHEVRSEFPL
jgi:hypothetical protein